MKDLISKLKNWKQYREWKSRKAGKPICDYEKGVGYYLPLGYIFGPPIVGRQETWEMESGKKMVVRCIDYEKFSDPPDMVKSSKWQFIQYVGSKPFAEMTWEEYINA